MAHRFKASDMKEMIRTIVRSEIQEVVTKTINEILSERYLRQLAEATINRPRGVGDTMHVQGDDFAEEPAPHSLENSNKWPFDKHPMKHDDKTDGPNQQYEEDEPDFSIFFEGTRSLKEIEANAPTEDDLLNRTASVPLPKHINEQKKIWTTLAGVNKKNDSDVSMDEKVKFEEARIKRMRDQLEVKV